MLSFSPGLRGCSLPSPVRSSPAPQDHDALPPLSGFGARPVLSAPG